MAEPSETERLAILLELKKDEFERNARSAGKMIDRLERRFDPLTAAEQKLERQQKKLNAALEAGTIDAKRHERGMELLQREYDQTRAKIEGTTEQIRRMNSAQTNVSGVVARNGAAFQQLGYQVGDFAVQVGAGTNALVAFGQQGSQMLGIFGAYGAIAGAALAIAAPLAMAWMDGAESAKTLEDRVSDLADATDRYRSAADLANQSTEDLKEKYGDLADEVRELYEVQAALERLDVLSALSEARAGILQEFGNSRDLLTSVEDYMSAVEALSQGGRARTEGAAAPVRQFRRLRSELGMSAEEAAAFNAALNDTLTAGTLEEQADALQRVVDLFYNATDGASSVSDEVREWFASVLETAQAARELQAATNDAADAADDVADAAGRVSFDNAASSAARLAQNLNISVQAASRLMALQGGQKQQPVLDPRDPQYDPIAAEMARIQSEGYNTGAPTFGGGSAPSAPSSGGGGGSSAQPVDIFANTDQKIEKLQEQMALLGETKARVVELSAKWAMLAEAKEQGIDVDREQAESGRTVREEIERQAVALANLQQQYDQAKERADFFADAQQTLKDGLLDAIVTGKDLSSVLQDLAQSFARAALEAALFNEGPFGSTSGGSGLLGGLIGSLFPSAKGNVFSGGQVVPFAEGGVVGGPTVFPMSGGKTGLMGEAGPEAIMPLTRVNGKLGVEASGGGGRTELVVRVQESDTFASTVQVQAVDSATKVVAAYDDQKLPSRIAEFNNDPRLR